VASRHVSNFQLVDVAVEVADEAEVVVAAEAVVEDIGTVHEIAEIVHGLFFATLKNWYFS
jgi:hypothetical protein